MTHFSKTDIRNSGMDMRSKINIYETVLIVFLLIGSMAAFIPALGYSTRGKLFPLIVIVLLIVMLALKLLTIFSPKMAARVDIQGIEFTDQKSKDTSDEDAIAEKWAAKWPKEMMMIFWLIFLLALVYLIGFLPMVPIFLFLFLKFQGKHSWSVSIITSLAVLAFVYGLFGIVLSVQFPESILFSN